MRGISALIVAVVGLAVLSATRAVAFETRDAAMSRIAQALVSQIGVSDDAVRLAVLPFEPESVPVAPQVARELHAGMLAALQAAGQGRIVLVAREGLKALIADLDRTDAGEAAAEDPAVAVLRRARDIDLLALGRMRRAEGGVMLSYRALRVEGADIVASTAPRLVPLTPGELDPTATELTLDQAVTAAARYFSLQAGDLAALQAGGIRFETSGAQPPFGRFLQDRVVAALQTALASPLSARKLVLQPVSQAPMERGQYRLEGRYWDFGASIELRLHLTGFGGRTLSWQGRITRQSVGPLRLRPAGDFGRLRDNDGLGSLNLRLATSRGRDPAFRLGEEMDLVIRAEEDFWLYCFYRDADGRLSQIFPNEYTWARKQTPRLSGGRLHRMPGADTYPFRFRFSAPTGLELAKCFAARRDITAELPEALRGRTFAPLSAERAAHLSESFRAIPNAGISEDSIVITVHE